MAMHVLVKANQVKTILVENDGEVGYATKEAENKVLRYLNMSKC